jgi:hypothetical protein
MRGPREHREVTTIGAVGVGQEGKPHCPTFRNDEPQLTALCGVRLGVLWEYATLDVDGVCKNCTAHMKSMDWEFV